MHAINVFMKTEKKPARNTVTLDDTAASEMADVAEKLGVSNVATLTRMALRFILRKVKSGELANVNGELVPNSQIGKAA